MGSSETDRPSAAFLSAFRKLAGNDSAVGFDAFMRLALFDPELGYYSAPRPRVGYGPGTDFFTASTSGPIFGELVAAAAAGLLGAPAKDFDFIEIGAETQGGVLSGVAHPFRSARTLRLGETLSLSGNLVVFSNELFDAQPFRRFRFREGRWREQGVAVLGSQLAEVDLERPLPSSMPGDPSEGDRFDAPLEAASLAKAVASQPWKGLFLAFDYGKEWAELQATSQGTGRAYYRHTQSNDLLARPGEQDLTCHVCWDWIEAELRQAGFGAPVLESQEAFFVHHAGPAIAAAIEASGGHLSPRKQAVLQLLHPAHLGQKFQVLHARRA